MKYFIEKKKNDSKFIQVAQKDERFQVFSEVLFNSSKIGYDVKVKFLLSFFMC